MYRKDQIKGIIALILFGIIALSYWLFEDGDETISVSIAALFAWFISMYFLNKKKEE